MVGVANFPNKTCDLAAEKVMVSKFRFKSCNFGTTTPTANFKPKNHNLKQKPHFIQKSVYC